MELSPLRVEAMMEACRRQLREQGKPPPYHLLALSLDHLGAGPSCLAPQQLDPAARRAAPGAPSSPCIQVPGTTCPWMMATGWRAR